MMGLIFHDGKKSCVGDQNLETEQNDLQQSIVFCKERYIASPHDLAFLLIKSKKHYKIKFSINLILKKNKNNFGRKKLIRKNVVAIDNVL